jgi:hypothetical protein
MYGEPIYIHRCVADKRWTKEVDGRQASEEAVMVAGSG